LIVCDRAAEIKEVNKIFKRFGCPVKISTIRSKYLNNIVEQNHRFIKRQTRLVLGFNVFESASRTLEGIEVAQMIRKNQFASKESGFEQFAARAR